ncbi:MAG: DUF4062 domain-containing protein [bacterium]
MSKKIKVMISSRCKDTIGLNDETVTFTDLRKQLKEEIEESNLFDEPLFEVWINEDAPAEEGSTDLWEVCLKQVDDADIVLILYNGNAGWAKEGGDIGICHAEMQRALSTAPAKVRVIELPMSDLEQDPAGKRNKQFRKYVQSQILFTGSKAENGEQVLALTKDTLYKAVVDMVGLGKREAKKGKYHLGEALNWSRMDFYKRKEAMEKIIRDNLRSRTGSSEVPLEKGTLLNVYNKTLLVLSHAVPAALSVAAAREMVGRPFLHDHENATFLNDDVCGPLHLIGCHKKVTESQAVSLLGQPDISIINAPFGIYAIDIVYNIQVVFLSDCRDQSSTRYAVQRFFEWLEQSGEAPLLVNRAEKRKRIVQAIAKEV